MAIKKHTPSKLDYSKCSPPLQKPPTPPSSPKFTPPNIDEELDSYSIMVRTDVFPSWEKTLIGSDGVARKVYSLSQLCENNTKEQVFDTILKNDQGSFSSENQEFIREIVKNVIYIITIAFTQSVGKSSTTKKVYFSFS